MLYNIKLWLVYLSLPGFGDAFFGVAAFLVVAGATTFDAAVAENT